MVHSWLTEKASGHLTLGRLRRVGVASSIPQSGFNQYSNILEFHIHPSIRLKIYPVLRKEYKSRKIRLNRDNINLLVQSSLVYGFDCPRVLLWSYIISVLFQFSNKTWSIMKNQELLLNLLLWLHIWLGASSDKKLFLLSKSRLAAPKSSLNSYSQDNTTMQNASAWGGLQSQKSSDTVKNTN